MASLFTRKFQNELRGELRRRIRGYEVHSVEEWLKVNGERVVPVDISLKSAERLVLIEIESHRQDPSNNIAKIHFWLEQTAIEKKLLVLQLFSPFYQKHRIKRKVSEKLGNLIMERYTGLLLYKPLSFQPELSLEEFENVYKNPVKSNKILKMLVKNTAKRIIKLL